MPGMFLRAQITPCGHICCSSCLFTAVKAGIERAGMEHHPRGNRGRGASQAWYVLLWSFLLFVILNVHSKDARFVARLFLGGMGKEGGWVESETYFLLLIFHLCVLLCIGFWVTIDD